MKQVLVFIFSTIFLSNIATAGLYEVSNVDSNDSLNMRSAAQLSAPIIISLPYNAKKIRVLETVKNHHSQWSKINWQNNVGWVNSYYLREQAATAFQTFQCVGTEPFWSLSIKADHTIQFSNPDNGNFQAPISFQKIPAGRGFSSGIRVTKAVSGNKSAFIVTHEEACSDGMSEINYAYSITALIDNRIVLEGCCNL